MSIYYLLGVYFGDGHIDYAPCTYQLTVTSEDIDLLENTNSILNKHFFKTGTISPVKNYFKLVLCSKAVCNYLLDIFCTNPDYCAADKFEKKGKLPKLPDVESKKQFVMGLMDSDGWISRRKNGKYIKYEVGFKNTSVLSMGIRSIMGEIGLDCNETLITPAHNVMRKNGKISHHRQNWSWSITPFNYINTLGFGISRKIDLSMLFLKERGHA